MQVMGWDVNEFDQYPIGLQFRAALHGMAAAAASWS
jgi:hypothetical protein